MTTGTTLSSYISSEQLGLGSHPTWLYSALLMAVIVGGMRTTRRGMLQLLQVCAGELWGKMCVLSPYLLLAALRKWPLPAWARRQLKWFYRTALKMLLGRRAVQTNRRIGTKGKHSLKHGRKRLNSSVRTWYTGLKWTTPRVRLRPVSGGREGRRGGRERWGGGHDKSSTSTAR